MGKKPRPVVPIVPSAPPVPTISKRQQKKAKKLANTDAAQQPAASATAQKPVPAAAAQSSTSEASSLEHAPQPTSAADLAAAEDRCFDPDVSGCKLPVGTVPARHEHTIEPLSLEIARGECLRRLRLSFADAIRKLQLTGNVVGAFERWHFGWLLAATSEASVSGRSRKDPLLPVATASPEADEALISELKDAGASHAVALGAVSALRTSADMEANNFAAARLGVLKSDPEEIEIELPSTSESGNGSGGLSHINLGSLLPAPLKISNEWLAKLRAMHAAAASSVAGETSGQVKREDAGERRFRTDLARLLLRYKAIGGSGFQAALGGGAFAVLRSCFGTSMECFASPLNARSWPFCSAFPDCDRPFGSLGSFLDLSPRNGAFEANPPFVPLLIGAMCKHMEALLAAAEADQQPLLFAVIVGASAGLKRHDAWQSMQKIAASRFGRAQWLVALHAHGYTEGHAHICKGGAREARRMSSCDTAVFIWATSAAAVKWPATSVAEAALRRAMKATVPKNLHKASKANKLAHAAKVEKKRSKSKRGA